MRRILDALVLPIVSCGSEGSEASLLLLTPESYPNSLFAGDCLLKGIVAPAILLRILGALNEQPFTAISQKGCKLRAPRV